MDDGKNHGMAKKTQTGIRRIPSFSRSLTVHSSAAAAAVVENKNLSTSQALQRNGSVKSLHVSAGNTIRGKVRKLCSIFDSPKPTTCNSQSSPLPSPKSDKLLHSPLDSSNVTSKNAYYSVPDSLIRLPGTEDRVVIYFTSLRGIRRTFQDCHSIRLIFRGFRVNLDERDVSLDGGYRKELQKVLGENNVSLPQVFIKGKYIGGADLVKQLLESGVLVKMIKGLPLKSLKPCDCCDDFRFIPCLNCSGSRKVFNEDEEQIKRCPDCNENGLVHCPLCSS